MALALKVPVFFVVTKTDIAPAHVLQETVKVGVWFAAGALVAGACQCPSKHRLISKNVRKQPFLVCPCLSSHAPSSHTYTHTYIHPNAVAGRHPAQAGCAQEALPGALHRRRAAGGAPHGVRGAGTHLPHQRRHRRRPGAGGLPNAFRLVCFDTH